MCLLSVIITIPLGLGGNRRMEYFWWHVAGIRVGKWEGPLSSLDCKGHNIRAKEDTSFKFRGLVNNLFIWTWKNLRMFGVLEQQLWHSELCLHFQAEMDITPRQRLENAWNFERCFFIRFPSCGTNFKSFQVDEKEIYYSELFSRVVD